MPEMKVDDWIWSRAQKESGMAKPATLLRNILARYFAGDLVSASETPKNIEADVDVKPAEDFAERRRKLGLHPDPFDTEFDDAYDWSLERFSGDEGAMLASLELKTTEGPNPLKNPRSFLISSRRTWLATH